MIIMLVYTAIGGAKVRSGLRQSIPSSSIDNCARVNATVPFSALGHTNRPRSNRLANRQSPSPSNHKSLTMSPRRPRNTKTWPEYGCAFSTASTCALSP